MARLVFCAVLTAGQALYINKYIYPVPITGISMESERKQLAPQLPKYLSNNVGRNGSCLIGDSVNRKLAACNFVHSEKRAYELNILSSLK